MNLFYIDLENYLDVQEKERAKQLLKTVGIDLLDPELGDGEGYFDFIDVFLPTIDELVRVIMQTGAYDRIRAGIMGPLKMRNKSCERETAINFYFGDDRLTLINPSNEELDALFYKLTKYQQLKQMEDFSEYAERYIYELATRFRQAIVKAKQDQCFDWKTCFKNYPFGCDEDACILLKRYLWENGIKTYVITGVFRDTRQDYDLYHSWLLLDKENTLIDINASRSSCSPWSPGCDTSIYIGADNDVYRQYGNRKIICDVRDEEELDRIYNSIVSYL